MQRDLVEQARRGDHEAFEVLATAAADRLFAIARLILRDRDGAQDAVQEALVHAWRELPRLRDPDRFGAWLHRLVVNACADQGRHQRRWSAEIRMIRAEPATDDGARSLADRDELELWLQALGHAAQSEYLKAFPDGKSPFLGSSKWGGSDGTSDGSGYFVSAGSSEVWKTGEYAEPIVRWGQKGTGPGQFDFVRDPKPADGLDYGGVAVSELGAPFGNVYVADSGNDRVQEFDTHGAYIRQWGGNGTDDGMFQDPIDVAVGPTGLVYVVDDVRDDIQIFSPEGSFLSKVGGHGSGDGQLDNAGSIFVGPDGTLYAADTGNDRVEAWAPDGTFLWTFGTKGTDPGQFDRPTDVGADVKGNVYVTDHHRMQIFAPDHTPIATWTGPGTTDADALHSVLIANDDYVIVNAPYGGPDSTLAYHLVVHWPKSWPDTPPLLHGRPRPPRRGRSLA